ncbi:hypothetical protein [Chryseobacterium sp. Leaf394]|uniref:hypothetical protein n=1 Tax=Chryseobacterium sp. Leaf394 TaxID=1736361 RepID=UPI0006F46CCB|nr:hypothetical protein [Chryseobacterium sp. Leaf394]KQS89189.1 hypothetical protein ASG21_15495 [Chryseobacterium sp. Leaf394]
MGIEIISALLASFLGALFPILKKIIEKYLKTLNENEKKYSLNKFLSKFFEVEINEKSYKQRFSETISTLDKAFLEVEKATNEFNELMKEKQRGIEFLEQRLETLSGEEQQLKEKVETLQKVPIEAVPYFEEMMSRGEKRSEYRDYILFVSGITVSIIITLILKFYFHI